MNAPKCPGCNQSNIRKLEGQRAVCMSCSKTKRRVFQFCWACQREWPRDASTTDSCMLPNCALRAALLSVKQIDDPRSSAKGCPYFRACPRCKALLTHNGQGCPKITCVNCRTMFCFRCLGQRCIGLTPEHFAAFRLRLYRRLSLINEYNLQPCTVVDNMQSLVRLGL
nr:potential E3 ubiquitin-protein ligase ariadne-2-like [Misgurnus anguillicaudatus]